jgi:UDP-glucose 4-epimerase
MELLSWSTSRVARAVSKKVIVFGSSGFIGQNLLKALKKERGFETIASDVNTIQQMGDIKFTKVDITNFDGLCEAIEGCDLIIHLAASTMSKSLENPKADMDINLGGTLNILEASRKQNVEKIIFASSAAVYGRLHRSLLSENCQCMPTTPYGITKLACEHYFGVYQELYGINYFIFRFFNVYGPGQLPKSGALIPATLDSLARGREIRLSGEGKVSRDFVFVEDVAKFITKAFNSKYKNEVTNLGTGKGARIGDVAKFCAKYMGIEPNLKYYPKRPGDVERVIADTTKLKSIFGEVQQTRLEDGLKKTVKWFKEVYLANPAS